MGLTKIRSLWRLKRTADAQDVPSVPPAVVVDEVPKNADRRGSEKSEKGFAKLLKHRKSSPTLLGAARLPLAIQVEVEKSVVSTPKLPRPEQLVINLPPRSPSVFVPPTPLEMLASMEVEPALSLLVILPSASHSPIVSRPSPLTRKASVPPPPLVIQTSTGDQPVGGGRRMSLAPGMGGGTVSPLTTTAFRTRHLEAISPSPTSGHTPQGSTFPSIPVESPISFPNLNPFGTQASASSPSSSTIPAPPPAFGKKPLTSTGGRSPNRRRPQTAATGEIALGLTGGVSRGSMALPPGAGLGLGGGGGVGRGRPGWEGDEVVAVLRGAGLEATTIRNVSHLPALISVNKSADDSPSRNSPVILPLIRASTPQTRPIPVILIPLCDSASLPSLSLLLAQSTTTTAVCFQQDLLERARQTEEEWLPNALAQIANVVRMRDQSHSPPSENPIIICYSANPSLSPATTSACVHAGASGVLKPPYDLDTARLLQRMVRAGREGRVSTVVELQNTNGDHSPGLFDGPAFDEQETTVILAPTALSFGGEHEGERVLSASIQHRRNNSTSQSIASRSPQPSLSGSRKNSAGPPSSGTFSPNAHFLVPGPSSLERRRRSVDTGGLALALKRVSRVIEGGSESKGAGRLSRIQEGSTSRPRAGTRLSGAIPEGVEDKDGAKPTELAELLSAMYCQTMGTVDVQMVEYAELSRPLSREHRDRLVDALATWNFKPHCLDDTDLFHLACLMFESILRIDGVAQLNLGQDRVNRLLFAVRAIYHAPNPYHNYVHAIDVLQATYTFLLAIGVVPPFDFMRHESAAAGTIWKRDDKGLGQSCAEGTRRAREVLAAQDVLGLMIAAMGHDVGHPGLSNAFMANAKTPLSRVYEDKSVLENMHTLLIKVLLQKHGLAHLACAHNAPLGFDAVRFRKVLYSSVLATDMSLHFAWMARIQEFAERVKDPLGVAATMLPAEEDGDRIMLCQAIIKCADISNPTRPLDVSEYWSSVLLEEWAKQACLEQELDLPVSVIASADAALQAKGQIGFIDLFTLPLFSAVSAILNELQPYADSCAANRSLWADRLELYTSPHSPDKGRLVQPPIDSESSDERFQSLFPLLLPPSLVHSPSSTSIPTTNPGPSRNITKSAPSTPAKPAAASSVRPTPKGRPSSSRGPAREVSAARAMRAVYPDLLEVGSGSKALLAGGPGVKWLGDGGRRKSDPNNVFKPARSPWAVAV